MVNYFYTEYYKTLMKEITGSTNKWKYTPCSLTGTLNTELSRPPKLFMSFIYRFNDIPIKILINRKNTPKIHMECKTTRIAKVILS